MILKMIIGLCYNWNGKLLGEMNRYLKGIRIL